MQSSSVQPKLTRSSILLSTEPQTPLFLAIQLGCFEVEEFKVAAELRPSRFIGNRDQCAVKVAILDKRSDSSCPYRHVQLRRSIIVFRLVLGEALIHPGALRRCSVLWRLDAALGRWHPFENADQSTSNQRHAGSLTHHGAEQLALVSRRLRRGQISGGSGKSRYQE